MQALLDAGPWVALIDKSETMHKKCFTWLQDFSGELYTTEAVLTEVIYLLNFSTVAQLSTLDFEQLRDFPFQFRASSIREYLDTNYLRTKRRANRYG